MEDIFIALPNIGWALISASLASIWQGLTLVVFAKILAVAAGGVFAILSGVWLALTAFVDVHEKPAKALQYIRQHNEKVRRWMGVKPRIDPQSTTARRVREIEMRRRRHEIACRRRDELQIIKGGKCTDCKRQRECPASCTLCVDNP